jgi:hypothetical protein
MKTMPCATCEAVVADLIMDDDDEQFYYNIESNLEEFIESKSDLVDT